MKTILLIITFITLAIILKIAHKQEGTINRQERTIQILRGDSVLIHTFFIDQSQKYDDFYVDYLKIKQ